MRHGLKALKASAQETDLNERNVSVGFVSKEDKFRLLPEEELKKVIGEINGDQMEVA